MVNTRLEDRIEDMLIGEELVYNENTGKYSRAENLNQIYVKEDPGTGSKIWASTYLKGFGNPENALPQASSSGTSAISSIGTMRLNENMGSVEQARVREWSKNIDANADPTQPVSDPALVEPAVEVPLSVRVVARSDSDDETTIAKEITHRVIAQDSDDEADFPADTSNQSHTLCSPRDLQSRISPGIDYTTTDKRIRRANRHEADISSFHTNLAAKAATDLVSANSFFANVPRDEEAQGEARFRAMPSLPKRPADADVQQNRRTVQQTKPNRRVGFDGAADESDEDEHHSLPKDITMPAQNVTHGTLAKDRSSSPVHVGEYVTGPQFDPKSYGAVGKARRKDSNRRYATQQNTSTTNVTRPNPMSTWPGPPVSASTNYEHRRRDARRAQPQRSQDKLIDCFDEEVQQSINVLPPPGLPLRKKADEVGATKSSHILDAPLDEIQKPSIKPTWDDYPQSVYDEVSVSTSTSSGNRHLPLGYNIQTKINKPDVGYMRNDMVSQLRAVQSRRRSQKWPAKGQDHSLERIDPDDEASSRRFYNTMNLRAPNTGKGKKGKGRSVNQKSSETAAQKAERIAKTKAELGLTSVPARRAQTRTQETEPTRLTKKAQQATKSNPTMGLLHADSLAEASTRKVATEVFEHMKKSFELVHLFPGSIDFGLQIGQLLVMPTSRIKENNKYENEKWRTIFDNGGSSAEVFFTDLLTCSGSDVDGMLETRIGGSKAWNKDVPGHCTIVLDFDCQDSSGSEFTIHLNLDGTYSSSKDSFVLQQVGLHCPGRTWDACAVLSGIPIWHDVPEGLRESITEMIASVHMRAGYHIDLFFRTPFNNSLMVREVIVKRTSKHSSQLVDEEHLRLKIVESKILYMTGHKQDKRLTRCLEKDHETMAQDDRVHFEVSLVSSIVDDSFEKNRTLQVGEMALADKSQPSALNYDRALCITRAALRLVDKIDWVGGYNNGTVVQRQYVKIKKEEEMARCIPPSMLGHSFIRPVHAPTGLTVAGPRSVGGARTMVGSTFSGTAPMSVQGIRSGTQAQIVTDERGNFFRIGLGGARIPLNFQEEASFAGDAVVPDDSASQVGAARQGLRRVDERPEGFW